MLYLTFNIAGPAHIYTKLKHIYIAYRYLQFYLFRGLYITADLFWKPL